MEATSRESILECRGLTKVFKDFWLRNRVAAVRSIDLDVYPGEVFGLLGPNGSGKSTTIKMVLGLLFPSQGTIEVFGHPPSHVGVKRRVGYLPEETNLYPYLNARETLDFYARLFHLPAAVREQRSTELLSMVGLSDVGTRPIGEYSKGMQRRIGLAQALINDPELLILDEPTNGLDPVGTRQVKDLILALKKRGKTVVVCSHLLADIEEICDRVTIMYGGQVSRTGSIDELLRVGDATWLRTGPLDDVTLAELREFFRNRGKEFHGAESPRQSLESLFLEIVEQAQREGATTSGAQGEGETASFLSDARAGSNDESASSESSSNESSSGSSKEEGAA